MAHLPKFKDVMKMFYFGNIILGYVQTPYNLRQMLRELLPTYLYLAISVIISLKGMVSKHFW